MKLIFSIVLMLATAIPARAETVWLVIGASDASPAGIARKVKGLGKEDGLIIQTADCGDRKNVFAWAAKVEPSAEAAHALLKKLDEKAPRAYVRRCDVKKGSLLAYGVPAVDRSIADVPDTAVNWEDKDRVSTVQPLAGGSSLVISRYYEQALDDPLEGRRERVILLDPQRKKHVLADNCTSASNAKTMGNYVAFQCAVEQAGNHLLHSVLVFDKGGTRITEIARCRDPRFAKPGSLSCESETVKADGTLSLRILKYYLPR